MAIGKREKLEVYQLAVERINRTKS
ncbi:Protein of unknown function [Lactobacillus helveticus CIRM-BIA 953]|uniref:Uncharacterized protein n=1 Tax=Lactobacillus helveticus CIRM-BIA 953 TaxID=1226335 RepID=U4QKW0_LACHE|nr:Protein of unknown function [Lactobacillus helveticus CIRM-BIA 953]